MYECQAVIKQYIFVKCLRSHPLSNFGIIHISPRAMCLHPFSNAFKCLPLDYVNSKQCWSAEPVRCYLRRLEVLKSYPKSINFGAHIIPSKQIFGICFNARSENSCTRILSSAASIKPNVLIENMFVHYLREFGIFQFCQFSHF